MKRVVTSTPVDVFDDEVGKPSPPTVRDTHFYDVYRVKRGEKKIPLFLLNGDAKIAVKEILSVSAGYRYIKIS